jgi:uncharacterized protein
VTFQRIRIISKTKLTNPSALRINVGFIVNQAIGYSRDFSIEIPDYSFSDSLDVRNLAFDILISRTTEGLLVQVNGHALLELECGYCLESFWHNLSFDFVEMFTFRSHAVEDTELILPDDLQIDLAPLLTEYLYLDIPINPMCKSNCQGLCPICGENQNTSTCNHGEDNVDPRLSVLKTLLDGDSE